jgi:hypothetical protein
MSRAVRIITVKNNGALQAREKSTKVRVSCKLLKHRSGLPFEYLHVPAQGSHALQSEWNISTNTLIRIS